MRRYRSTVQTTTCSKTGEYVNAGGIVWLTDERLALLNRGASSDFVAVDPEPEPIAAPEPEPAAADPAPLASDEPLDEGKPAPALESIDEPEEPPPEPEPPVASEPPPAVEPEPIPDPEPAPAPQPTRRRRSR